jgi:hypothetical protein
LGGLNLLLDCAAIKRKLNVRLIRPGVFVPCSAPLPKSADQAQLWLIREGHTDGLVMVAAGYRAMSLHGKRRYFLRTRNEKFV